MEQSGLGGLTIRHLQSNSGRRIYGVFLKICVQGTDKEKKLSKIGLEAISALVSIRSQGSFQRF